MTLVTPDVCLPRWTMYILECRRVCHFKNGEIRFFAMLCVYLLWVITPDGFAPKCGNEIHGLARRRRPPIVRTFCTFGAWEFATTTPEAGNVTRALIGHFRPIAVRSMVTLSARGMSDHLLTQLPPGITRPNYIVCYIRSSPTFSTQNVCSGSWT